MTMQSIRFEFMTAFLILAGFNAGCSPPSTGDSSNRRSGTSAAKQQLVIRPLSRPGVFQVVIAGGASNIPAIAERKRDSSAKADISAVVSRKLLTSLESKRNDVVPVGCSDGDFEQLSQRFSRAAAKSGERARIVQQAGQGLGRDFFIAYLLAEIEHADLLDAITPTAAEVAAEKGWESTKLIKALKELVVPLLDVDVGGYYAKYVADSRTSPPGATR